MGWCPSDKIYFAVTSKDSLKDSHIWCRVVTIMVVMDGWMGGWMDRWIDG